MVKDSSSCYVRKKTELIFQKTDNMINYNKNS